VLGRDDLMRFHRDGFLGPLPLTVNRFDTSSLANIRRIVACGSAVTGHGTYARHLDSRPVFKLCTDPAVLEAVRLVLGHNLLLWNSGFWIKQGEAKPTPWHQDVHYWPVPLNVTAWIALTDTDEETGCLMVIPGSHGVLLPLVAAEPGALFEFVADPSAVPDGDGCALPMAAGQFVLLHDRVLHRSAGADEPRQAQRWGLAARFTASFVHVPVVFPLFPGHHCILVSGEDHYAINELGPPPAETEWHA